jgi:hypothetical protein
MPPTASAIAPRLDKAAMSAPVKAKPEVAPSVTARPELTAHVVAMVILVDDESPEEPVATIVFEAPGDVLDGIVTVVEKEPVELLVFVPKVVPLNVRVTTSLGSKFVPLTVSDPPGTEHPELAVISMAFVGYCANAAVDHPRIKPTPTTVATRRCRFMGPFCLFISDAT